jgi:hypothetical protein
MYASFGFRNSPELPDFISERTFETPYDRLTLNIGLAVTNSMTIRFRSTTCMLSIVAFALNQNRSRMQWGA